MLNFLKKLKPKDKCQHRWLVLYHFSDTLSKGRVSKNAIDVRKHCLKCGKEELDGWLYKAENQTVKEAVSTYLKVIREKHPEYYIPSID